MEKYNDKDYTLYRVNVLVRVNDTVQHFKINTISIGMGPEIITYSPKTGITSIHCLLN